jgi:uncharacterized protein (TIGR03067 family)
MRQYALVLVLAAGVAVAAEEKKGAKKADPTDGTWTVVSIESGGVKLPDEELKKMPVTVTFKGDKWTVKIGSEVRSGTSKIDLMKQPAEIDTIETEGPDKGTMMKGIMEIKGDTIRICFDTTGKTRPKEFSTKDNPGYMLLEHKREKK